MTTLVILGAFIGGLAIGIVVFYFTNRKPQSMVLLQNQIQDLARTLDARLGESSRLSQSNSMESNRIIREVVDRLGRLDEAGRRFESFADQLNSLQDILKNPKQRGIFGEYFLETLLSKAFQPNQYQMQYKFKNGDIVDAVLFFGDKIIPIDSKFSLENYNRIVEETDPAERERLEKLFKQDLKNRIDETAKYIKPDEGTLEFAFMFIPAEGIYYDLLVNKIGAIKVNTRDLLDYAVHEKKVHIVSPTTFYVTLQSMMVGMRAYAIQESTQQIIKNIGLLGNHLRAYEDYFQKVGGHLNTTVNAYNQASREFGKIDKDILKISGEGLGSEVVLLDKISE